MFSFFTSLEINIVVAAVALACGVVFSQKIKDWAKGIPSDLRKALNNVETDTLNRVKLATASVVATLPAPAPAAPKVTVVAAAPAAPLPSAAPPAAV